jgi:hypothetical protein
MERLDEAIRFNDILVALRNYLKIEKTRDMLWLAI